MYRAVICDQFEVCETLLNKGADPNIPNNLGQIPLHSACESGQHAIAELLLNFKSNPNFPSGNGETPLHYASLKGDFDMVKILLEHNALPNSISGVSFMKIGRTPLHCAVESGALECIKLLRVYGADPEISDKQRQKPLDLAGDPRISEALQEYRAVYLTSKSEEISEVDGGSQMYELFNTFGENLQSVLRDSKKPEKPQLLEWLTSINLQELYCSLVDSGYDDHIVMAKQMLTSMPITENNLKEIGIQKPGLRKKLLFYLEEEGRRKINKNYTGLACVGVSLKDVLESLGLEKHFYRFVNTGYDDYPTLVKMENSKWAINEKTLTKDIEIFEAYDIQKILNKVHRDYINLKNDLGVFYEEPKTVACSKCKIF